MKTLKARTLIKLLVLGLWLVASTAPALSADLYQWTDPRGVVNFSDNPYAVPKEIRNSGRLQMRKDFFPATPTRAKLGEKTPVEPPASSGSDTVTPMQVEAIPQPRVQVIYAPQENTIVVVNGQQRSVRHRPCRGERCAPAFRPNANDRQYIHPSVFGGGSRQYVRP